MEQKSSKEGAKTITSLDDGLRATEELPPKIDQKPSEIGQNKGPIRKMGETDQ